MITKTPADLSHFKVITCLSNSNRYERRYELYHPFAAMCRAAKVDLITVELVLGHRPFMVTTAGNPFHVQLRSIEELWHKENMLNLGTQRAQQLDPQLREVLFSDCDLRPMAHPADWFAEIWQQLQHFETAQAGEYLIDLDSECNPLGGPQPSFMSSYMKGVGVTAGCNGYVPAGKPWLGWPGGAWAWNISALNQVGGLYDKSILGSGDFHMAQGLIGQLEPMAGEKWSSAYSKSLYVWQERALRWLKKDVGVVPGGLLHDNHGPKAQRYYVSRKQILVESEYDPVNDVKYDHQGLLQLETDSPRQIKLRDQIRAYFRSRLEDVPEYRK